MMLSVSGMPSFFCSISACDQTLYLYSMNPGESLLNWQVSFFRNSNELIQKEFNQKLICDNFIHFCHETQTKIRKIN